MNASIRRVAAAVRSGAKELSLDAESAPVRFLVDFVLKRRARHAISFTQFQRMHAAIRPQLDAELDRVLGFTTELEAEVYVRRFEREFARLCGRPFAVGTHSGTSALQLSLVALGIGRGDEVITVPNTYVATALAITNVGATPVFVDVDKQTCNLDVTRVAVAVSERTRAVLPVHLYGRMADLSEVRTLAARHDLAIVEDACQAFGAECDGRTVGSDGDAACFSFSPAKNFSGFGNGGMIVADDRSLIARLRQLRNPESATGLVRSSHRTPCYLDAVQVAFLRAKLPFVDRWTEQRRRNVDELRSRLAGLPLQFPGDVPGVRHSYYRLPLRMRRRDELLCALWRAGIRAAAPYRCLHLTPTFADLGYPPGSFPIAEMLERDTLLLPVSQFLTDAEKDRIVACIERFFA